MLLIPGTSHIITWQKQNLLDTQTYYIRAVIRNVRTNTIIDTLDLVDLGSSMRFSKEWLVPQDPLGFGVEISIVKTVYEDSGYTQVSGIYGAWEDRYLIYQIKNPSNTGGGMTGINYGFFRELFDKKIEDLFERLLKEKPDYSELKRYIDKNKSDIKAQVDSMAFDNKMLLDQFEKISRKTEDKINLIVDTAKTTVSKSILAAENSIRNITEESVQLMTEHRQNSENSIIENADKQLDMMVKKFDEIGMKKIERIENIGEVVTKGINDALSVPLKLETQEVRIVRDKPVRDESKNNNIERAKKLLDQHAF